MQGISIFQQIYAPRVAHVVTGFDGISHNTHSPYAIGGVVGSVGKMTAIVANDQADTWHIVNLKRGNLFDAVAVLGAFDESEAANMAMRYHGQYFDAVCGDVCESNTGGLQRFLNHPVYMRTNRPVYAEELAKLQDVPSTQAILWDGVQLKSHNGSSKHLLLDMMRCDDDKALLEKMDFVEEESQLDGEIAEYDALVVEAYKLESTVSKLALAMDKATSIGTLKVAKQTLSKPKTMRGFGVIQQLVSFELSDGQAVSIIFNVSDSEANASAKMTKDDLLVAWKYKLNSRDITAAVQPNATQNVSLNMIASRIMGLADANSEKFVAAQKKKDAMQTELANTNQRVKDLQSQEQALLQEIADLQKQLDEKAKMVATEGEKNANDYSFVRDDFDKQKYRLVDADGKELQVIWKSGATWAMATGESFKTLVEAKQAAIDNALSRKETERQEAESRAEVEGMGKAVQSAHAELDARVDALDARGLGYLGAFLNYNTTDISKIAEKAKLEHPDDLKAALDKLDNAMAQDEVRKKLAQIEKQPTREDALALAVKLTKEMPDEADKIRISLNLAIATNKWKGIKITLPQQPAKLKTDADVLASMKKIQKSLVNTGFNLNLSKANTDFIRGTLIKGSGSSMSSQEFSYFNNKGFDLGYIEYGNQFDFDTFNPILKGIEKWLQGEIVPSFFVGIDDDWDMDIMATPLKIKEALDKAAAEGLAIAKQAKENSAQNAQLESAVEKLSKFVGNTKFDSWAKKYNVDEQLAQTILDLDVGRFVVSGLIQNDLPPNLELISANDYGLYNYWSAKPETVKGLSQEAFNILVQQDNYGENTARLAYTVLRFSDKKSEFEYVASLGTMKNSFRIKSQDVGGKLYNMAQQYLESNKSAQQLSEVEPTTDSNPFAAHDEIAREYGYSVSNDGSILKSNGVATGAVLSIKKGRLIVNGKDKSLLFSGKNPDGLSIFLNTYWYANKKPIVQPTTQQPVQPVSEPSKPLSDIVIKALLSQDSEAWYTDDYGDVKSIYSADERDGFVIRVSDKSKQVDLTYTDWETDKKQNETFVADTISPDQVIDRIKAFIAKHEQKSVELLPVQPISEPPVVEQDNAEKNMTAADFLALGGKEWVKDDMTRIYINAKVFNDLMGTSFGDSNNKFFFDVNTSALMRSYKGKKPQVEKQYEPVQQPTEAEPTPAPNKKMYTPKDILDSDLSIDEKISEAEKLLESDKLNAAKQKIKIDESNKFYLSHVRQAEGGYLFTDLPRNASLTSVVHARIGIDVGFIEYLKNRKENPPKPADTQAQTPPDIGDTVIGDTTLSDLFRSDMAKKANNSPDLRIARQSIFDAEDAAANAIQSNSIAAFSKYADMFPKTYNALLNRIEPPMTNPDRDYLQSIIDGDVDLSNADEIEAKLTDINERLDADLEPLFEQAAEVFAQYGIAQAATN